MITNILAGIIGIAGLVAFLGILVWWIRELPLIIICVTTLLLLFWDFVQTMRTGNGRGG